MEAKRRQEAVDERPQKRTAVASCSSGAPAALGSGVAAVATCAWGQGGVSFSSLSAKAGGGFAGIGSSGATTSDFGNASSLGGVGNIGRVGSFDGTGNWGSVDGARGFGCMGGSVSLAIGPDRAPSSDDVAVRILSNPRAKPFVHPYATACETPFRNAPIDATPAKPLESFGAVEINQASRAVGRKAVTPPPPLVLGSEERSTGEEDEICIHRVRAKLFRLEVSRSSVTLSSA